MQVRTFAVSGALRVPVALALAVALGLFLVPLPSWGDPVKPAADHAAAEEARDDAPVKADEEKPASAEGESPEAAANDQPLAARQDAIALRYKRFEGTLLQMYEYMQKTDPDRAELLRRAYSKSKSDAISQQMNEIVTLLEKAEQLGDVIDRQDELVARMKGLLDLLQSEDRISELEREKQRIKDLLKDLGTIIGKQNDVRAKTDRGEDPEKLADRQTGVAKDTQKLVDKIDGQDAARAGDGSGKPGEGKPGEGKPGEGEPSEGKSGEGKPGEGKPGEGKPGEEKPGEGEPGEGKPGEGKPGEEKPGEGEPGEGKPGEGKPGEGKPGEGKPGEGKPGEGKPGEGKPGEGKPGEGKPGEGKPGEGKPGEGKPGEGQPGEGQPGEGQPGEGQPGEGQPGDSSQDPNRTPGRDEIEQAHREMERAIEELKKRNNEGASDRQDDALAKLIEAKEKLEEILRQLREEERELLLAALEARFQKMLAMQLTVYTGTISLDKTPKPEWLSRHHTRSRELSRMEEDIVLEAEKALTLLKEEGSSLAFPESVEQLRDDMQTVAARLGNEDVGELTQVIERDIIEALQEIIEALQKEMEKKKDDQPPPPPGEGEPQDPPLVDALAELKMLRSLQFRVNRRTKRLGNLIPGEQATEPEIVDQLQQLSRRQSRIQQAAYDLATGRNQ